MPENERGEDKVVWARKRASTMECPKTVVTAESLSMLDTFHAWKILGAADLQEMTAREVDGLMTLEREYQAERKDAER